MLTGAVESLPPTTRDESGIRGGNVSGLATIGSTMFGASGMTTGAALRVALRDAVSCVFAR
jgi:hypothetical protein